MREKQVWQAHDRWRVVSARMCCEWKDGRGVSAAASHLLPVDELEVLELLRPLYTFQQEAGGMRGRVSGGQLKHLSGPDKALMKGQSSAEQGLKGLTDLAEEGAEDVDRADAGDDVDAGGGEDDEEAGGGERLREEEEGGEG